jgi:hypothetical protein
MFSAAVCGKALAAIHKQEGTLEADERSTINKRLRNLQHVELDKHKRQDIIFTHVGCLFDA